MGTVVDFLAHHGGDAVAVAVQDVRPGTACVAYLDSEQRDQLEVGEAIPYGHKVALVDLADGAEVIEYGVRIGIARRAITRGELVHVHNLRSAQWQHSA
ncbi:MAG TPA: UxaA family hydrolase [Acidimicrobiales bacterium]|nr:UxaA family hydrolase [Acidimicrobiales bacterium]